MSDVLEALQLIRSVMEAEEPKKREISVRLPGSVPDIVGEPRKATVRPYGKKQRELPKLYVRPSTPKQKKHNADMIRKLRQKVASYGETMGMEGEQEENPAKSAEGRGVQHKQMNRLAAKLDKLMSKSLPSKPASTKD